MNNNGELVIAVIGAGGIGSNLISMIYPALQRGDLVNKIGDIRICIYDSDIVEKIIFHIKVSMYQILEV